VSRMPALMLALAATATLLSLFVPRAPAASWMGWVAPLDPLDTDPVLHLKGDPNVPCHPSTDLDLIDERGMAGIGQLEGRAAGLEDRHTTTRRHVGSPFRETEGIAVEAKSLVVVGRSHDEAKLTHAGRVVHDGLQSSAS
jgi:hypothetical protein